MEYTLIRSKRKTLVLQITGEGNLEVRAPMRMSVGEIEGFIEKKENWINRHLKTIRAGLETKREFVVDYGNSYPLCGEEYMLEARNGSRSGFDGEVFLSPPHLNNEELKATLVKIYKGLAENILAERVTEFSNKMGVSPVAVKISGAKARWGSCSGKNSLNFSWRLVLGSYYIIDYVVVHELAHIKEHNHGKRFWAEVEKVLPDYRERKRALAQLQERLSRENWEVKN